MKKYLVYYYQPDGIVYWKEPRAGVTRNREDAYEYTNAELILYAGAAMEQEFVSCMEV